MNKAEDIEKKEEVDFKENIPSVFTEEEASETTAEEETAVEAPVVEEKSAEEAPAAEETTETGTVEPVITYVKQNAVLFGALGVVIVLLVILIVSTLRGKKKGEKEASEPEALQEEKQATVTQPQSEDEPKPMAPIRAASVHEQGAREDQQDSFGISDYVDASKGMLAVVADGMGGLTNGKAVSSLVVNTCMDVFYSLPNYISHEDMLLQMAVQSNGAVNQMLRTAGKSGSTMVGAVIGNGQLHFLTIGDSHIYLCRGGALLLLNREHIFREELSLEAVNGRRSIHQANHDPQAKSLTSYLGIGKVPHLDRNVEGIKLISGDKILLASDGVFGTLSAEQMEMALALPAEEAAEQLRKMVQAANKPYQDNYTALILEYIG